MVSQAFLDEFNKARFKNFNFFDFRKGKPSLFASLMKTATLVLVPGESTSFISEVKDNAPIILCENGAMNEAQYAAIQRMNIPFMENKYPTPGKNSAAQVATSIKNMIERLTLSIQK